MGSYVYSLFHHNNKDIIFTYVINIDYNTVGRLEAFTKAFVSFGLVMFYKPKTYKVFCKYL